MPTADTFECEPIKAFVQRWQASSRIIIDPFARNSAATYTNDINPNTKAQQHMDARDWLDWLCAQQVRGDLIRLDPPYSPRQISECYAEIGQPCTMADTQNGAFYKQVRDAAMNVLAPGAVVLSFGWNSTGMGRDRGFRMEEILLVCHGGAHNDTICIAERRVQDELTFTTPTPTPSKSESD